MSRSSSATGPAPAPTPPTSGSYTPSLTSSPPSPATVGPWYTTTDWTHWLPRASTGSMPWPLTRPRSWLSAGTKKQQNGARTLLPTTDTRPPRVADSLMQSVGDNHAPGLQRGTRCLECLRVWHLEVQRPFLYGSPALLLLCKWSGAREYTRLRCTA